MKQLSGLDASFLYLETPSQFGHVSSLSIFERPADPSYDAYDAVRAQIDKSLHRLEPLRRRLRNVPLKLDHPFWEDDEDFDLDYHLRRAPLPAPGNDERLGALVAQISESPLDRTRPLWEAYVIEGLADDRFAMLIKIHHATIDGASGMELLTLLLDRDPAAGSDLEAPPPWRPEAPRTGAEMVIAAGANLVRKPGRGLLLGARTLRDLGRATKNPAVIAAANGLRQSLRGPLGELLNRGRERSPEFQDAIPLIPLSAPRLSFNAPITANRDVAFRSAPLDQVKAVKNALGVTVNDVVLAVCAGGMRTWLARKGELPEQSLTAAVPVSVRVADEPEKWTNRISFVYSPLPTQEPDPFRRVVAVHQSMVGAKAFHDAIPARELTDFAQFPPPAIFARAMRAATRLVAQVHTPVNLMVSNIPGPRETLYAAGARLLHYYPVSTVLDGFGLTIVVQSYGDSLDFGLVACRDLVPDLWDLCDDIIADLDALSTTIAAAVPEPAAGEPVEVS